MALSCQRESISTLSAHRGKYDVFLSFRGETRGTFTDHLFKALKDRGINVFRDHELERGIDLPSMLSNAIKESRFAIIVLSPDYASSTWCLQELSKAFEQMKDWKTSQRIIPIFYKVEPSDVRKQMGTFDKSFKKHEENLIEHKWLQQWRTALTDVSAITGWNRKYWEYETDFIAKIVEAVYIKLVCACCKMRIDDEELYFSCMGAVWHRECFSCNACNQPFTDNEFWNCGDHPYHKSCYKKQFENSGGRIEYMEHPQKYRTGSASEESDAHSYGVVASEITTKDFSNEIKLSETSSAPVPVPVPETENLTSTKRDSGAREPGFRRFSDPDVAIATKNSPNEGKLGGVFGAVYRSFSASLGTVAVKKISRGFKQATKECIAKVKDNSLRLRNLLQVIGWFLLLYHLFMPNGILDFHVLGTSLLNCGTCLICMSLAFALYFPERLKQLVVHLSIKSSNIHRILFKFMHLQFISLKGGILYFHHCSEISSQLWARAVGALILGWNYTLPTECEGCLQQRVVDGDSKSNNILLDSIFNGKFMPNGSLDSQAFYGNRSPLLDYAVMTFISMGSVSASFYLAQRWEQFLRERRLTSEMGPEQGPKRTEKGSVRQGDIDHEPRPALPWDVRDKIYEEFATALLDLPDPYLHQGWQQCVLHRDLKPCTIVLDSSFNAKLGDFGLARLMDPEPELGPKRTEKRSVCRMRKDSKRSVQLEEWVSKLDGQGRLLLVLAAERLLMMIQCHLQRLLQIRIRIHQPHHRIQIQVHSL